MPLDSRERGPWGAKEMFSSSQKTATVWVCVTLTALTGGRRDRAVGPWVFLFTNPGFRVGQQEKLEVNTLPYDLRSTLFLFPLLH
jgi:hypothetical protein